MTGVKIEGLDSSLDLFQEITDDDIKSSLNEIGKEAKKAMQNASAVDKGKAKNSIKSRIKRLNNGTFKLVTRFTEEYYAYQEFETEKSNPKNIGKVYRAIKGIDERALKILEKLPLKGREK